METLRGEHGAKHIIFVVSVFAEPEIDDSYKDGDPPGLKWC